MRRLLLWSGPTVLAYLVLFPWLSVRIDREFGLSLTLPWFATLTGIVLFAVGSAIAVWSAWLFDRRGDGTPNPLWPPVKLVASGPYRCSRNPMMMGGWAAGFGLALLLGSPALALLNAFIVVAGVLYVRLWEEPRLIRRFGQPYLDYQAHSPRWFCAHGLSSH